MSAVLVSLALAVAATQVAWRPSGLDAAPATNLSSADPEALSLFMESRQIGNPPTNRARLTAGLNLAREIQRLDPDFGGGYAAEFGD